MIPKAKQLFVRAFPLQGKAREAFLQEACGDDAELRLEVKRLLTDSEKADSFFADTEGATIGPAEFKRVPSEREGDVVGRYKLLQEIGEGGFGTVYLAQQTEPVKRRVALEPPLSPSSARP